MEDVQELKGITTEITTNGEEQIRRHHGALTQNKLEKSKQTMKIIT